MPRAVHVVGRIWAVSAGGKLRYADAATSDSWADVPDLPSSVVAIAACELRDAVFAACNDGSLHLFNAQTARLILSAPTPLHAAPLCLLPLPLENALFVGLADGAVVRLHLASLAFDCMLGCGVEHSAAVNALDADDQYLYSGGDDAVVLVWDLKEATAVREISMPSASIHSLLRVDVTLWAGLESGSVEVFDIFGDDSNGIECIAEKTPHVAPVTDLIKVGEMEVWSVSAPASLENNVLGDGASVAVWDTRDFSFSVPDDPSTDVMSVTVVSREPFENVTVLTLSDSLGPQYISKSVRGSLSTMLPEAIGEYGSGEFDERVVPQDDLSSMQIIRDKGIMASSYEMIEDGQDSLTLQKDIVVDSPEVPPISAPSVQKGLPEQDGEAQHHRNATFDKESTIPENGHLSFIIPRPVSETLMMSLRKVSELLVTLLTDDLLSPLEGHTRESSDELRAAVANITKELNIGRQLIESCAAGQNSDNSVITVDENDVNRNVHAEKAHCCESATAQLRKQLDREIEKNRILQKDLSVVSKERDLLAEDLLHVKAQSETTLSSLEGLIRDNDTRVASKNALVVELRKECKQLRTRYQAEVQQREKIQENLNEEIEKLTKAFETSTTSAEEQLASAYDKIETKQIEIQSQRDSIRAMENKIESLRNANQSLNTKCKAAEYELATSLHQIQTREKELAAKSASAEKQHEKHISELREEHQSAIEKERCTYEKVRQDDRAQLLLAQQTIANKDVALSALKNKLTLAEQQSQRAEERLAAMNNELDVQRTKMKTTNEGHLEQLKAKQLEWEQRVRDVRTRSEQDLRIAREQHVAELQEKQARIECLESEIADIRLSMQKNNENKDDLSREVARMRDEKFSLEQELEHRVAAANLYEQELERLKAAEGNLRAAAEELQDALRLADGEIEDLRAERDHMKRALYASGNRPRNSGDERSDEKDILEDEGVVDSKMAMAMEALLASANGEIEQMSNQLEAMHRAHRAQERELAELRMALQSPARVGIRNPSFIPHYARSQRDVNEVVERRSRSPLRIEMEATADKSTESNHDLQTPGATRSAGSAVDENEGIVNDALQEVQDGMAMTKDKLRELSSTARRYKRSAQTHLEMLPALYELEGELIRISQEDFRKAERLTCARGIVQSVIAQYYSTGEKRAVLRDYDENVYAPSSRRLDALRQAVAQLRAERIGSTGSEATAPVEAEPELEAADVSTATDLPTPRRLLTF